MALVCLTALASAPAVAAGAPCDTVDDAEAFLAVITARDALRARWLQTSAGWASAYKFGPEPRNPFALKSAVPDTTVDLPIEGFMAANAIGCVVYEVTAPRAYVVRFTAEALQFNENGAGWTRPLPPAVIMISVVELRGAAWTARDMPDGRTAVPPFAVLRHPAAVELEMATFNGVRRHVASGKPVTGRK